MSSTKHISQSFLQPLLRLDRRAALEMGSVVVLAVLCAACLYIGRLWPPVYHIDLTRITGDSPLDLVGVNAIETNQSFSYTWSTGYTLVQFRDGYTVAPTFRASVRLRAANPQGSQPLTFLVNEQPLITVTPTSAFQTYDLLLPNRDNGDHALRFAFTTKPFSPPGDTRELGVILTDITLQPLPSVDLPTILYLNLVLVLLWIWLRLQRASLRDAALICGVLAALLSIVYSRYYAAPLSFAWLGTIAICATALGALLARDTISRIALAAMSFLMSFSGMLWASWLTDDAFISFRYAQNLVAGHGLVYNVGERVEGYTNFLWTMLAAAGLWSGADIIFLAYISNILIGLAILFLSYWIASRQLGSPWALLAALFVSTSQSLLVYTGRGSGLETGLFTLLVLAAGGCALHAETRRWYGVLFALATLTRPEGILLMALTVMYQCLTLPQKQSNRLARIVANLKLLAPIIASYLIIFVPFFIWRLSYYGELLPNTFYAKTGGGLRQIPRGLGYTGRFLLSLGGPFALLSIAALVRDWRATLASWRGYVLVMIAAYTLYIIVIGGDHFPGDRFFVPLVPWFALMMADGIAQLYAGWRERLRLAAPIALSAILLLYTGNALFRGADFEIVIKGDDESLGIWRELGWWFSDHARPDESIAAMGAGAIAFYSDRTTIDLLGLNDKHIARVQSDTIGAGTAGHEKRDPAYVLNVRKPTYIPQIWDEYFGGERALAGRYSLISIHTRYGRAMKLWKLIL